MNKHTPGPWFIRDDYKDLIEDSDGIRVAAVLSDNENYDARLIAAAPELLAALEELLDIEGPQPGTSAWADKTRALIAKAKGEV